MYLQQTSLNEMGVTLGPSHLNSSYKYLVERVLTSKFNPNGFAQRIRERYFELMTRDSEFYGHNCTVNLDEISADIDEENIYIIGEYYDKYQYPMEQIDDFIECRYNVDISCNLDVWIEEELQRQGLPYTGSPFRLESRTQLDYLDKAQNINMMFKNFL